MKKMLLLAVVLMMSGTAWAQAPAAGKGGKVDCTVNGADQKVASVAACKAMGGTVVKANAKKGM